MPPGKFDPDEAMATIEREQVTNIGGVPTVMWRIVEAESFEKLRPVVGQPHRVRRRAGRARARRADPGAFPQVRETLSTAYGLTETASVATSNAGAGYLSHPSSVGRAAPTVEIQIVDADGKPRADRRERRDRAARPDDHEPRLLEPARRDRRRDAARRLVPQRRHRLPRRGRLPLPRRPGQGHDHPRRRERVLRRDRARALRAPRRPRRRGRRRAAPRARRGGQGRRAAAPRVDDHRRGRARVLRGAARELQGAGVRRAARRAAPAQPRGQGPEERAARRRRGVAFTPSAADDSAL